MKLNSLLISLALLVGCSGQPAYVRSQFTSDLSETQISENAWRVVFTGGASWSMTNAENHALLRCADITLQNGFKYFVMDSSDSMSKSGTISMPDSSTTTLIGNTAYTSSSSVAGISYFMPRVSNTIVMYSEKPDVEGIIYDAGYLCDSLARRLEAKCNTF